MTWRHWILTLALGAASAAGCFTQFEKIGGTGSGAGGVGGAGGGPDCSEPVPGVCAFTGTFEPFGLASGGTVTVTDIGLRPMLMASPNIYLVGRFTGPISINGSEVGEMGTTDGFVLEVTTQGDYVNHVILKEVDATSTLTIAQRQADTSFVVGGHYSESNSVCTGGRGLFARRFNDDFSPQWSTCIDAPMATALAVHDVTFSELDYVALVGDFSGTLGPGPGPGPGAGGVDGFIATLEPVMQNPSYFLAEGTGDASIRRIMSNPVDGNQWLVAGDFDGELSMAGLAGTETRTAFGQRDLFLASVDEDMDNPNLALARLGNLGGGAHRMLELARIGPEAVILADVRGPVTDGATTISAPTSVTSVLAMTFDPPNDQGMGYAYSSHYLFTGGDAAGHALHAAVPAIAVGAEASTDVVIETQGNEQWGLVETTSCERDVLLTVLEPAGVSRSHRCGGSNAAVTALGADETGTTFFAAIDLPLGETMMTSQGDVVGPATVIAVF